MSADCCPRARAPELPARGRRRSTAKLSRLDDCGVRVSHLGPWADARQNDVSPLGWATSLAGEDNRPVGGEARAAPARDDGDGDGGELGRVRGRQRWRQRSAGRRFIVDDCGFHRVRPGVDCRHRVGVVAGGEWRIGVVGQPARNTVDGRHATCGGLGHGHVVRWHTSRPFDDDGGRGRHDGRRAHHDCKRAYHDCKRAHHDSRRAHHDGRRGHHDGKLAGPHDDHIVRRRHDLVESRGRVRWRSVRRQWGITEVAR
jgi:hypothetical protein